MHALTSRVKTTVNAWTTTMEDIDANVRQTGKERIVSFPYVSFTSTFNQLESEFRAFVSVFS